MSPSSYTVFARKVKGKDWFPLTIRQRFMRQVSKSDYAEADLEEIMSVVLRLAKKS